MKTTTETTAVCGRTISKAKEIIITTLGGGDTSVSFLHVWRPFLDALVLADELDEYRADLNFKRGVQKIVYILDQLHVTEWRDAAKIQEIHEKLADSLIGDCPLKDDSDYLAILQMIESLEILAKRASFWTMEEHITDLRINLNAISYSQKMVLESAETDNFVSCQDQNISNSWSMTSAAEK